MKPVATIVFITHNRSALLSKAIFAAQQQSVPVSIIVMDDGSTDDTARMMENQFPDIEYHRSSESLGPCYQRNQGVKLSETEVVFVLDDDSVLQSVDTIKQTLSEFDHPRTGAIAIPFVNILQHDHVQTQAPDTDQIYLTHAFVAASHAIRRDVFLLVGGYREEYFYMGEEGDLCLRMLENKYFVRLGTADPIHHYQPPNRISRKADALGRRNDILFVVKNVPSLQFLPYLVGTTFKGLAFGLKIRRPGTAAKGLLSGYWFAFFKCFERTPVSPSCFTIYRQLKKEGIVPFASLKQYFT